MARRSLMGKRNPLRAWGRRAFFGLRDRPDVQILQLQRRVEVLERMLDRSNEPRAWERHLVDLLTPHQFTKVQMRRLGSAYDGGYVLPEGAIRQAAGVVSVGVGNDNSVDVDLAAAGLTVHAWDHTVDALPQDHERIHFHRIGLGEDASGELISLDELMSRSFGDQIGDLILMLDAEGAEWSALASCAETTLRRFSVIAVEFHDLGDLLVDPGPQMAVLGRLAAVFEVVCVHPNNYATVWPLATMNLPDAVEVTYVRRDLVAGQRREGNAPADLLAPCCPDLPDVAPSWVAPA